MTTRTTTEDIAGDTAGAPQVHRAERQKSTEAKSAYKTTELNQPGLGEGRLKRPLQSLRTVDGTSTRAGIVKPRR